MPECETAREFDVFVAGAGIAGCVTALELRRSGWRVGILHRPDQVSRIESLSPPAAHALEALSVGAGSAFSEVVAWWGSDHESRASYSGARIAQRTALADALRSQVLEAGVAMMPQGKLLSLEALDTGWKLTHQTSPGCSHRFIAGYLVDASGYASAIGTRLGARRRTFDQLCCLSLSVFDLDLVGTWTESVADGWWNLCCAGGEGTLSFYSVASVIREAAQDLPGAFRNTRRLRRLLAAPEFGACSIKSCGSSRLVPCAGRSWLAVGDAAATLQPLASGGIAKALRDARLVRRALERGPDEYEHFQVAEFRAYMHELQQHYALESRWPESPVFGKSRMPWLRDPDFTTLT